MNLFIYFIITQQIFFSNFTNLMLWKIIVTCDRDQDGMQEKYVSHKNTIFIYDNGKLIEKLSFPRQITMYLLRNELKMSYPAIGGELGGRDHTTAERPHRCEPGDGLQELHHHRG